MNKFKVGDRVRIKEYLISGTAPDGLFVTPEMAKLHGKETRITAVTIFGRYNLAIDNNRFFWSDELLLPSQHDSKIIIMSEGMTVTAKLIEGKKKVVREAKATCSPEDKFDFETGAKLAFDRLMKRAEPERERFSATKWLEDTIKKGYSAEDIVEQMKRWVLSCDGQPVQNRFPMTSNPPIVRTAKAAKKEWLETK